MGREVKAAPRIKTPTVRFGPKGLPDVPNLFFVGTKLAQSAGRKNDAGEQSFIYNFAIEVASPELLIQMYDKETETYSDTEVHPGDTVTIFGDSQLNDKLNGNREDGPQVGERVRIVYHGKKLNPKSGRKFKDYTVMILDASEAAVA